MEPTKQSILVVDDEEDLRGLVELLLLEGFKVDAAVTAEEATEKLATTAYDVLVANLMLPGKSGIALLEETLARSPRTVVIMMAGDGAIDTALEAMKKGAHDYLIKPFKRIELPVAIRKGLSESQLRSENQYLRNQLRDRYSFDNIIGTGPAMRLLFDLIETVAGLSSTCLIQGEPGTGKELIAKAIHFGSPRRDQKLVSINCGAIPENLLECELFGHTIGAFTGALQDRVGRFEQANRGTIFLDEVGRLPLSTQAKLLRVLQEREIERVGGASPIKVDVRIIAATSANLEKMVEDGTFREDLYYRLNVIPLNLPPLRERREDIPLLVQMFIQQFCERHRLELKSVAPQVLNALIAFDWPGNVRQLENLIERMVALTGMRTLITMEDLPAPMQHRAQIQSQQFIDLPEEGLNFQDIVTDMERKLIVQSLRRTNGNKKMAAKLLHLKRTTLIEKIKRIGLAEQAVAVMQ